MADPAFVQLLDMGIPGGRARAALRRSKGDVMSAAERVFAGEFDDIPSDDEGEEEAGPSKKTGLQTPDELPPKPSASQNSRQLEDDDDAMMSASDDAKSYDEEEFVEEDDDNLMENCLLSDPYAGIFFSKERVETVNEPIEKETYVDIVVPNWAGTKKGKAAERLSVRILGRGEWMSGCPEGNEQSYLFQLYSMLEEGSMPCSSSCGHSFKRKTEDFFVIFPSFSAFISYINSHIHKTCPSCSQVTCLACGERTDRPSALANGRSTPSSIGGKGKGKEVVEEDDNALLHCPNIQGVLLGVGLHLIEQVHNRRKGTTDITGSPSKASPPNKKRRTQTPQPLGQLQPGPATQPDATTTELDDDADDAFDDDEELGDYGEGIGVGLGSRAITKGTGYAGNAREDRSGQIKAEEAQALADKTLAKLLAEVEVYLPSLARRGGARTSDHLVHPTALAHLRRRSAFVNDLLRNDSLLDMSKRGNLYRALFDWLEVVSSHEALASMLAMPQMRPVKTEPAPGDDQSVSVTYEGSSSPRELLENCVIQAQAALKGLSGVQKKEEGDEKQAEEQLRMSKSEAARIEREKLDEKKTDANDHLRQFCERIIASAQAIDKSLVATKGKPFVDRMRESLPRLPDAGVKVQEHAAEGDLQLQTLETVIKIYEEWAGRARFQYCDMSEPSVIPHGKGAYKHAYSSMLVGLDGMDMPKRSLAIAKELAVLTTSLPVAWNSTIFLRVDEARVDCLKAMIIGPEGTPYENGCFIFDIFLPVDYNIKCPMVKSMTTNGGRYRYNPNLYADGKVCLSLLGTWSGPGWISGHSTLLQVLISIQSLILCEEPYLNEPGWAGQAGTAASKAYSANVRRMVVVDAMANNIKTPPYPFENEIKTHFRLKAKSIKTQLDKWKALDDGKPIHGDSYVTPYVNKDKSKSTPSASGSQTPFDRAAEELKGLLDGLDPSASSPSASASAGAGEEEEVKGKKGKAKGKGGKGSKK